MSTAKLRTVGFKKEKTVALDQWFSKWAVPPPGGGGKLEGGAEGPRGRQVGIEYDRVDNKFATNLLGL